MRNTPIAGCILAAIEGTRPTAGDSALLPLALSGLLVGAGAKVCAKQPWGIKSFSDPMGLAIEDLRLLGDHERLQPATHLRKMLPLEAAGRDGWLQQGTCFLHLICSALTSWLPERPAFPCMLRRIHLACPNETTLHRTRDRI